MLAADGGEHRLRQLSHREIITNWFLRPFIGGRTQITQSERELSKKRSELEIWTDKLIDFERRRERAKLEYDQANQKHRPSWTWWRASVTHSALLAAKSRSMERAKIGPCLCHLFAPASTDAGRADQMGEP